MFTNVELKMTSLAIASQELIKREASRDKSLEVFFRVAQTYRSVNRFRD